MQKYDGEIVMPEKYRQMNVAEMREVEGGFPWPAVITGIIGVLVDSWDSNGKIYRILKKGASKAKYKKKGKKWEFVRVIH